MRGTTVAVSLGALLGLQTAAAGKPAEREAKPAEAAPAEEAGPDPAVGRPKLGPAKIDLGDDLELNLPAEMGFFDRAAGKVLMEKMGNRVGDELRGLVFKKDADWMMVLEYIGEGYVKDDDAAELDPDKMLTSIKEGTEEANEFRKQRGFAAIHVEGWTEPPHYERAAHHLIWGIKGKHDDGTPASTNFYTRVLGRRGYVALNLMDDPATIEASKVEALAVLRATTFKPGARYADFDAKTDKVAEYGLAALVLGGAGVAAVKLVKVGLLAKFGAKLLALIIAGKKAIVLLLVGLGAGIKSLLGRRKRAEPGEPPPSQAPPSAGPPPTP